MTTEVLRCSVVELAAIERAARSERQLALLQSKASWTRRDYPFIERLRDVRGLNIIEDHEGPELHVVICGSVSRDGFTKRI